MFLFTYVFFVFFFLCAMIFFIWKKKKKKKKKKHCNTVFTLEMNSVDNGDCRKITNYFILQNQYVWFNEFFFIYFYWLPNNLIYNELPITNIRQQCMKRWHVGYIYIKKIVGVWVRIPIMGGSNKPRETNLSLPQTQPRIAWFCWLYLQYFDTLELTSWI